MRTQGRCSDIAKLLANDEGFINSIEVPYSVMFAQDLTWVQKIIYSYILSFEARGRECFQTSKTISRALNIDAGNVRTQLLKLEKLGYITREDEGRAVTIRLAKAPKVDVRSEHAQARENDTDVRLEHAEWCVQNTQGVRAEHAHTISNTISTYYKREGSLHSPSSLSQNENLNNNQTESQTTELESPSEPNLKNKTKEGSRVETTEVDKPKRKRKEPSSPSCAAPLLPTFPDENDPTLRVRLSPHDAQRLEEKLGLRQLLALCSQIESYLQDNPKKRYSDFYKTILNWARRSAERGLVFGYNRVTKMWGYYPMWQVGKHVELERDMEGSDD